MENVEVRVGDRVAIFSDATLEQTGNILITEIVEGIIKFEDATECYLKDIELDDNGIYSLTEDKLNHPVDESNKACDEGTNLLKVGDAVNVISDIGDCLYHLTVNRISGGYVAFNDAFPLEDDVKCNILDIITEGDGKYEVRDSELFTELKESKVVEDKTACKAVDETYGVIFHNGKCILAEDIDYINKGQVTITIKGSLWLVCNRKVIHSVLNGTVAEVKEFFKIYKDS